MVGTKTALKDNPGLTVRHVEGRNPIRIVLDNKSRLPVDLKIFDDSAPTIIFNSQKNEISGNLSYIKIAFSNKVPQQILGELYRLNIQSVIIEGGKQLLESFLETGIWDEAYVFVGDKEFHSGIEAPEPPTQLYQFEQFGKDELYIFRNIY